MISLFDKRLKKNTIHEYFLIKFDICWISANPKPQCPISEVGRANMR